MFKLFMKEYEEVVGETRIAEIEEGLKKYFDEDDDVGEEVIYEYKLLPEIFL